MSASVPLSLAFPPRYLVLRAGELANTAFEAACDTGAVFPIGESEIGIGEVATALVRASGADSAAPRLSPQRVLWYADELDRLSPACSSSLSRPLPAGRALVRAVSRVILEKVEADAWQLAGAARDRRGGVPL